MRGPGGQRLTGEGQEDRGPQAGQRSSQAGMGENRARFSHGGNNAFTRSLAVPVSTFSK